MVGFGSTVAYILKVFVLRHSSIHMTIDFTHLILRKYEFY